MATYKEPHFTREQSAAIRQALGMPAKKVSNTKSKTASKKKKG